MSDDCLRALEVELRRWNHFGECLLHDIRPIKYGYGIDVALNYVWGADGKIRENIHANPRLFVIRLCAVEWAQFRGGLSDAMRSHPECINWGLSEVAGVSLRTDGTVPVLVIHWENERRIDIAFNRYKLFPPAER